LEAHHFKRGVEILHSYERRTRRVLRLDDFLDMTKGDVIFGVIENVTLNQVPDLDGDTTLGLVFTVTYEGLDSKYTSGVVQYSGDRGCGSGRTQGNNRGCSPHARISSLCS